ncbi:MAG TPA: NAD+ synthase [Candidatus Krumholzibacteria bacterium]|nr:NAD+ synthase [Candidatus Krumholzibacteria bacterium]
MRIALAQINTIVGDTGGNIQRIITAAGRAAVGGADLVVFHELCISGYPPKDLLERPAFIAACGDALARLVEESRAHPALGIVVGCPMPSPSATGKGVSNSALLIANGKVLHRHDKLLLPTYDVFDEARYFEPAEAATPVRFGGEVLGISICEDAWNDPALFRRQPYRVEPIAMLARQGATVLVNISASPFAVGKEAFRAELIRSHARRHGVPFVFVNQVGGNDELVFDGRSLWVDGAGAVCAALPAFEEAIEIVDLRAGAATAIDYRPLDEDESILRALVLGMRDYFDRCGFRRAVVGLSGGIDSAVTLCIAVEALGAGNVRAVAMPSPISSPGSVADALELAANLGVRLETVPIGGMMEAYDRALQPLFDGRARDVTEENIQARIRGNILMALSNKFGCLVLSTGNKSELAVGYCTLYGDMSGGLALISDVPKTTVYRLAEMFNREAIVIPRSIIDKAPSAELRPDQKDVDTLPPYEILDPILDLHIEDGLGAAEIAARGYDPTTVAWVIDAVRRNEYKRRQAAPGLKVTSKAFGVGRRFPIAARYSV